MIVSVSHEQLILLSFPDAQVEYAHLDRHSRRLKLRVDNAWLDSDGGSFIGAGELVIAGWDYLDVRVYQHETDRWSNVAFTSLRDICEFLVTASMIVLRGFAKDSGLWTEVSAVGDQIQGTYTPQIALQSSR